MLRCWNRFSYSFQSQDILKAWAAMSFSDSRDPNWYTDTGASARMTADAGNLKTNITLLFTLGPIKYMLVRVLVYVFFILMMTTSEENLKFELKVVPDILISVS